MTTPASSWTPTTTSKIYESDPFAQPGSERRGHAGEDGRRNWARTTRPDIKLGICGEHGGDPSSVEFCHKVGLNYVSCSPYRRLSPAWLPPRLLSNIPERTKIFVFSLKIGFEEAKRFRKVNGFSLTRQSQWTSDLFVDVYI
ncbi:MAG: putative PEP-binding protein [Oscillospiraceae bacterium]